GARRGVERVGGIGGAPVRLPDSRERRASREVGDVFVQVYVPVRRAGLEGDVETAVGVPPLIGGGGADAIEEHDESTRMAQVGIQVAVVFTGDLEVHLQRGDRADCGVDVSDIRQARGIAVGYQAVGRERIRFGCLRLK